MLDVRRHCALGVLVMAVGALASIGPACRGSDDKVTLEERVRQALKSVRYVTAQAVGRGDRRTVADRLTERLPRRGWTFRENEPVRAGEAACTGAFAVLSTSNRTYDRAENPG